MFRSGFLKSPDDVCWTGAGRGTWDVGRGTWDVGRGTWDVGRGTWDVGRGTWDVGRGPWDVGRGTWDVAVLLYLTKQYCLKGKSTKIKQHRAE